MPLPDAAKTATNTFSKCKHCGQPIQLIRDYLGHGYHQWMHKEGNYIYHNCLPPVAEPINETPDA